MNVYKRDGTIVSLGTDLFPVYEFPGYTMSGLQANGVAPYGQAVTFEYNSEGAPIPKDSKITSAGTYDDFEVSVWETPSTAPVSKQTLESCKIYSYVKDIEVGEMVAFNALPFPFDRGDTYVFDWESSNESVAIVKAGLVTALTEGEATITARLQGTEFYDSVSIVVSLPKEQETNMMEVSKNWVSKDGYAINSEYPASQLNAIMLAIQEAIDGGYDGIRFEKSIYYGRPNKVSDDGIVLELSDLNDFTIDFNGSKLFMMDNGFSHCPNNSIDQTTGYVLFRLTNCDRVFVKNLDYYGERTQMEPLMFRESEFSEFSNFLIWRYNCNRCKVENVNFYNTCGFNICSSSNLCQNVWSLGIVESTVDINGDTAIQNGGHVHYDNLASGRMNEIDGSVIEATNCIYTPNYITINVSDENMPTFRMGTEGYTLYNSGISARWYDVFWYDTGYNLIAVQTHLRQYDIYERPVGAAFFKCNFYQTTIPKKDGDNGYVITMFPAWMPNLCKISHCNFFNPHASAISITGGQRFIIDHCYMMNGKRYGWSVDFEDGWMEMRSNVIYRNICSGNWIICEGDGNKICSNHFENLNIKSYNENYALFNNHIKKLTKNDFAYGLDAYNWVGSESIADESTNVGYEQWGRDTKVYY